MQTTKAVLISLLISAAVSASSVLIYHRYFAVKIVAVDVRGYVDAQRTLFLDGKLSKDDLDKNLSKLRVSIDGIPANTVALVSDVVVKNAETINP